MSATDSFSKLKSFLETQPASQKALRHLKPGVQIGIIIGHQIHCALYHVDKKPIFEQQQAKSPDVIFYIKPESVDILCKQPAEDVGEFGIEVLKEYLSGGVRIQIPGSLWAITKNGYLGMIAEGGQTLMKFLASHGIHNITKVLSTIRELKKN